tara:strand:+ start:29214 stop:31118 length:1905 start_codon:yes stop_codon:yes gene_type:complete
MEASYFYYRPTDLLWDGNNKAGDFLDKGFNVKFLYRSKNKNIPNIAIGLDDFAGTGYFNREYIVSTKSYENIKLSLGIGWGKFAGQNTFNNPLSLFSEKMDNRPGRSDNFQYGGAAAYDQWFRGDATLFGGVELYIPRANGLKLKLEYDPLDYLDFSAVGRIDASRDLRKKDSDVNIGLSYPINKFVTIDASFIKGNTFNLTINMAVSFNEDLSKKPKFKPNIKTRTNTQKSKRIFYEDLLFNLNNNNLLLQTASLQDETLNIAISTSQHRNAIRSSSYAAHISKQILDNQNINVSSIKISHINAGVELNNISYLAGHLDNNNAVPLEVRRGYATLDSGNNSFLKNEFQPKVKFPVMFSSLNPVLVNHIGNPERFYFGGIALQHVGEIQFNRNLLLSSEISYAVYNNFQDTISGPASRMRHVRTDLVDYLKEGELYITNLQLDYIWSPYKNLYTRLSGGIFETMFGGIGAEFLYKPFDRNFTIGSEIFYVKQRDFNQKLSFKDYSTTTGHINFGFRLPLQMNLNLSYGRYLAKDDGYTFDISRETRSGFKAGVYFTKTDVPIELFGEGSFDKGFYFQIPIDLFSSEYKGNYTNFKLSPLTRDGGAKLQYKKDLKGMIYNSTYNKLNGGWDGFLN